MAVESQAVCSASSRTAASVDIFMHAPMPVLEMRRLSSTRWDDPGSPAPFPVTRRLLHQETGSHCPAVAKVEYMPTTRGKDPLFPGSGIREHFFYYITRVAQARRCKYESDLVTDAGLQWLDAQFLIVGISNLTRNIDEQDGAPISEGEFQGCS